MSYIAFHPPEEEASKDGLKRRKRDHFEAPLLNPLPHDHIIFLLYIEDLFGVMLCCGPAL